MNQIGWAKFVKMLLNNAAIKQINPCQKSEVGSVVAVCYSVGLLTLPSTSSQYQATPADTVASDTVSRPQSDSDTIVNTCPVTRG